MKFTLAVAGITFAASCFGQVTPSKGSYLLRMKFKKGVVRFDTKINQVAPAGKGVSVGMPFVQKIVKVDKGVASMAMVIGPMLLNGKSFGEAQTTQIIRVNSQGMIQGSATTSGQGLTIFPVKPVKSGDVWSSSITVPSVGSNTATASATYQFVRLTQYLGKPVAELKTKIVSNRGGDISGTGTTLILASDGSLLHSDLQMNFGGTGVDGKPTSMRFNVVITRK
jgi:hypothetical protein